MIDPNPIRSHRRHRLVVLLLASSVGLIVFVAALPSLLSIPAVANVAVGLVARGVHGTVRVDRLSLGWFAPPVVEGLSIRSPSDEPVIRVPSIVLERPLWVLALHPRTVGRIRIDRPELSLIVREDRTSNFRDTFPPRRPPPVLFDESVEIALADGRLDWRLGAGEHDWSLAGLAVGGRLVPAWESDDGRARLLVVPGTLVDHAEITPGMCDDVLKFIAPVAAGAPTARGRFSLRLEGVELPVGAIVDGRARGTLSLHEVDIIGGPMAQALAAIVKLPPSVELARESNVVFEMHDRRVHHEGLEFALGDLHVRTSGDVGFDDSLDLMAELIVRLPPEKADGKRWLSALDGKSLRIPIGGTLHRPEPDWRRAFALNVGANLPALLELARRGAATSGADVGDLLGRLTQPADGSAPAAGQVTEAAVDAFQRLMELRRQRLDAERAAEATPETGAQPPPRRGLLGRALGRLLEAAPPAEPNAPSTVEPPSAPRPSEPAPPADGDRPSP